MDDALAEMEFLARSGNRIAVLEAVSERPHTRSELAERTGASQATLGRILRDFEERNWLARTDGAYVATPTGTLVADGVLDLRKRLETERRLRPVVGMLPDELDVDLRRLRTATLTTPTETRPSAPVTRSLDILREAGHIRAVSRALNDRTLRLLRRRAVADGCTVDGVFAARAIEALVDDDRLRPKLRELVAAESADIHVYEGPLSLAVTLADGTVCLLLRDDDGVVQAALDTDDEAVAEWAASVHEQHRTAAEPLSPADIV